jgi:hypothetical protein
MHGNEANENEDAIHSLDALRKRSRARLCPLYPSVGQSGEGDVRAYFKGFFPCEAARTTEAAFVV